MKKICLLPFLFFCLQNLHAQKKSSNPVLAGFYPDPSICRVDSDYYIVNSSFAYYPGLPIFHSKDLVNWKQIGYAMNRPEQLNLIGAGVSRGLFAPTIRYHKGIFYIVCTLIDKGGNFVITASNPAGPWSNPTWLKETDGIDPSLFFDEDDKAWLIYNSVAPDNKPLWDGHRTIRMRGFDYKNLRLTGEEKLLVNGGTDISKKPVWIEGPHIYRINGWYYLLCAEGGTGYNHSEVVFRSKSVDGPYIPYEQNPILTQRQLDPKRKNPITTAGHADLVEATNGKWYVVFLGCRPYEDDHYNIGRETFLAPVTWTNGWPVITKDDELVKYFYPLPYPHSKPDNNFSGNFIYRNNFTSRELDNRFAFLRTVTNHWYNTIERKGCLTMQLRPETMSGNGNPSFIGFRQSHNSCTAMASMEFRAVSENEKAGMIIFQNEHHFYFLCKSVAKGQPVLQLLKSTETDAMDEIASQNITGYHKNIFLKIEAEGADYSFFYSFNNKKWILLKDHVDGKFLSTKTAGGFVGSLFGMYATSSGKQSASKAFFDRFEYKGDDEVYR